MTTAHEAIEALAKVQQYLADHGCAHDASSIIGQLDSMIGATARKHPDREEPPATPPPPVSVDRLGDGRFRWKLPAEPIPAAERRTNRVTLF